MRLSRKIHGISERPAHLPASGRPVVFLLPKASRPTGFTSLTATFLCKDMTFSRNPLLFHVFSPPPRPLVAQSVRQPFATPTHVCTFPHASTFKIEVQSFLSALLARTQVNSMSSRARARYPLLKQVFILQSFTRLLNWLFFSDFRVKDFCFSILHPPSPSSFTRLRGGTFYQFT